MIGHKNKGFTLLEILIVIAIMSLLFMAIVIRIGGAKAKARDAQRITDINSIATALVLYSNEYHQYPIYDGTNGYPNGITITGSDLFSNDLMTAGLISQTPIDPLNQDAAANCNPKGGHYYYYYSNGSTYTLEYCLETRNMVGKNQGYNYLIP